MFFDSPLTYSAQKGVSSWDYLGPRIEARRPAASRFLLTREGLRCPTVVAVVLDQIFGPASNRAKMNRGGLVGTCLIPFSEQAYNPLHSLAACGAFEAQ